VHRAGTAVDSPDARGVARAGDALVGIVAALAAFGASELVAGLLPGAPSLLLAVGQTVIDLQPAGAKDVAVALFGTNDKLALEIVVVLASLVIAAGLGILATVDGTWPRRVSLRSRDSDSWRRYVPGRRRQ
jgi:hypothetical protein